ncbi:MAG: acyl carrier protein [Enhydrobacter sp.]|nr:MAG: acyl carrier protein [Enhydrobacter sp.]
MTDAIEARLLAVAAAFLKTDATTLNLDSGPGDVPRWDSFAQVGLIAEVEAQFDLAFDVEEITTFETLRDIHDAIRARLGAPVDAGKA